MIGNIVILSLNVSSACAQRLNLNQEGANLKEVILFILMSFFLFDFACHESYFCLYSLEAKLVWAHIKRFTILSNVVQFLHFGPSNGCTVIRNNSQSPEHIDVGLKGRVEKKGKGGRKNERTHLDSLQTTVCCGGAPPALVD